MNDTHAALTGLEVRPEVIAPESAACANQWCEGAEHVVLDCDCGCVHVHVCAPQGAQLTATGALASRLSRTPRQAAKLRPRTGLVELAENSTMVK